MCMGDGPGSVVLRVYGFRWCEVVVGRVHQVRLRRRRSTGSWHDGSSAWDASHGLFVWNLHGYRGYRCFLSMVISRSSVLALPSGFSVRHCTELGFAHCPH